MGRKVLQSGHAPSGDGPQAKLHGLLPHDRLVTAAEVATALGLSTRTILRHIKAGLLPAVRVGKAIRIRTEDVVVLLTDASVATPATDDALHTYITKETAG